MGSGLQIFNQQGQLTFDSSLASGGVCLDIVLLPGGTSTYSFPYAPQGRTPFIIYGGGFVNEPWSYSTPDGVPTFTFTSGGSGVTVGMYLK